MKNIQKMITKDNYELYVTDYLDGRLSAAACREMEAFLLINNDLEEMLEDIDQVRLIPPSLHFTDKLSLKKEEFHECPDYYAIATAEESLSEEDKKALKFCLSDTCFQDAVNTYKELKFKPDLAIRFEHKTRLYRKSKKTILIFRLSAVAALILLILGISIPLFHLQKLNESIVWSENSAKLSAEPVIIPEITTLGISSDKPSDKPMKNRISKTNIIKAQIPERTAVAEIFHQRQVVRVECKTEGVEGVKMMRIPLKTINTGTLVASGSKDEKTAVNPGRQIQDKLYSDEILLSESAGTWKPSGSNFQSKDIITSAITAGKNIAEIIRNKEPRK